MDSETGSVPVRGSVSTCAATEGSEPGERPSGASARISVEALALVSNRLRAISEPIRLRLMWALDDQRAGATVHELTEQLGVRQQTISHHLAVLYQAGLVDRERHGPSVHYELIDWSALWLVEQIAQTVVDRIDQQKDHFDQGQRP